MMKKMAIGNKMYDVASIEEFTDYKDAYNPKFTAIEIPEHEVVLPIKGKLDEGPGIYFQGNGMVAKVVKPLEENMSSYSTDKIIDYSNPKNIDEVINKDNLVRDIENDILTTKENIFQLNIGNDDSPEMVAIKQAINNKQVDIKQYESRFNQFQNDIRLLKGKSITLGKLVSTCNNFDIEATLTLKDKSGKIANPMNTEIKISLTNQGGDEDESI